MGEPRPFHWDFDRTVPNGPLPYATFSVGVYQWLPKAGGKGQKRSKTIRVIGYVAEPERVFAKAEELCRRLNASGARAEEPPEWLQKQYALPKPDGFVVGRTSTDLTGAQVRAIRGRVMNRWLLPAGFVKAAGGTYVRRAGEQIHLIDFQPSTWGHQFTVNLGFHYTFVPPLLARRAVPLAEFSLLDCMVRERLGFLLPERRDVWFEHGTDPQSLEAVFDRCAATATTGLHEWGRRWADPAVFLDGGADDEAHGRDEPRELPLACIAIRLGRLEEAAARLRTLLETTEWATDKPLLAELLKRLEATTAETDATTTAKDRRGAASAGEWVR